MSGCDISAGSSYSVQISPHLAFNVVLMFCCTNLTLTFLEVCLRVKFTAMKGKYFK